MNELKVIILLATYNRSQLITDTLDSILKQTHSNWECIIIDDNSIDSTSIVVKDYVQRDRRFSYYLKTNRYKKGLSGTRNYGLDLARERKAGYIQFFDDDDIMHPKKLEMQLIPFLNNPNLNFSLCKFEKLIDNDQGSTIVRPEQQLNFPHLGDAVLTGDLKMNSLGPLWTADFIDQFRFDETLNFAEEWELYVRIGYSFPDNYASVEEFLFQYRKHNDSLTLREDANYERRKTSAIIRIKISEYLTKNHLHTKSSVVFMANTFLVYSYRPSLVKKLLHYVRNEGGFSKRMTWYLEAGLFMGRAYRKFISRLGKWV